jgi:hypothetical protein
LSSIRLPWRRPGARGAIQMRIPFGATADSRSWQRRGYFFGKSAFRLKRPRLSRARVGMASNAGRQLGKSEKTSRPSSLSPSSGFHKRRVAFCQRGIASSKGRTGGDSKHRKRADSDVVDPEANIVAEDGSSRGESARSCLALASATPPLYATTKTSWPILFSEARPRSVRLIRWFAAREQVTYLFSSLPCCAPIPCRCGQSRLPLLPGRTKIAPLSPVRIAEPRGPPSNLPSQGPARP